MKFSFKRFASLVITAVMAVLPFVAIWQHQAIFDWWRLRDYTAPAVIAKLAADTTMTDEGRHLLYVYRAELQNSVEFNQSCQFNEQSIVVGCYVSGQGIYIYNVTDERLSGVHEVTAAHEVLHAAYDRLSGSERERIDALTQQVLAGITSQRIKDSVEAYRKQDPSIVPNELHSIIGTEVADLPSELEAHYAKYFSNRKVVVAFSDRYEQAFIDRKQHADDILAQLESLKKQIDNYEAVLAKERDALQQEYAALQADRAGAEPESFNARVRQYNARVRAYNSSVQASHALIDRYNALIKEYNQVILEGKELMGAIDSRPDTIEQQ